jgi:hypothetical protein
MLPTTIAVRAIRDIFCSGADIAFLPVSFARILNQRLLVTLPWHSCRNARVVPAGVAQRSSNDAAPGNRAPTWNSGELAVQ